MSLYKDWDYTSNPFKPLPIQPALKDVSLLVGRENEKKKIKTRLKNNSGIITIEGENGIGKTSVINTSIYELFEESISSIDKDEFYLPCTKLFQISSKNNLTEFIDDFYFSFSRLNIKKFS
jgi:Cdc6-like AAA superfamily ATPase